MIFTRISDIIVEVKKRGAVYVTALMAGDTYRVKVVKADFIHNLETNFVQDCAKSLTAWRDDDGDLIIDCA